MKRQVEEAEEEIDRLESSKKKLQRELEEQMDVNEQLQGQLNSLKKNLRWASAVTPQGPSSPAFEESLMLVGHPHFCCLKTIFCCRLLGVIPSYREWLCALQSPTCSVGPHMCHPHTSAPMSARQVLSLLSIRGN